MKKKLIFIVVGVLALGGAAFFVVGSAGVPVSPDVLMSKRGLDEYYTSEPMTEALPDVVTNLRGSGGKFIRIQASVVYRIGDELTEAASLFAANAARLQDAFTMFVSSKTLADVETAEQKNLLKEEMKELVGKIIFPEKKGRIEDLLFRDFKVQ